MRGWGLSPVPSQRIGIETMSGMIREYVFNWDSLRARTLERTRMALKANVRSMTGTTGILPVLGVCLAGCTSWKPDPVPPCDETQRQQLQIANLPGCAPFIQKTYNYDF